MGKEFIKFRWTNWTDSVGYKLRNEVDFTIEKTSWPYDKYISTSNTAKSVLCQKVTYSSQKAEITSLEVKSNV